MTSYDPSWVAAAGALGCPLVTADRALLAAGLGISATEPTAAQPPPGLRPTAALPPTRGLPYAAPVARLLLSRRGGAPS